MPSSNRRRVRKAVVCLVLLGLAAWTVPSYFSAERYRHRLQAGLEQALHRPVKFRSLSIRLLPRPGFSIQNVEVGEDPDFGAEPFARVDQIDCDLRWHSLWRSRMDFSHLHLDHPDFNVVLNSSGKWNVETLLLQSGVSVPKPPAAGERPPLLLQELDLDADDARVDFQVGNDKKAFALTEVRAHVQVNPAVRRVQFQVTASPFRSDLSLPTPGPLQVSGTWALGSDLAGPIDAHLRTQGALLYDWIPIVLGNNPQIYGVMDSDVHITGSLPNLIVEGDTSIAQLQRWGEPPASDTTPLVLHYRGVLFGGDQRVQVDGLDASFGDSHLHFTGSVERLRSDPRWDCVVSIDHSRLEDVTAMVRRFQTANAAWNLKGRLNAMLTVQGGWADPHFGGYIGVQQASLETGSGTFPFTDASMRINDQGAVLAPVQITLAPHMALTAQGAIERTKARPRYDLHLTAKGIPLLEATSLGRGLGIRAMKAFSATGSISGSVHLTGTAWPPERPTVSARAELSATRLLIPGLTEPLNLPHASIQINGSRIVADPVVAVLGTSVFTGRVEHSGGRNLAWKFDLHASSLDLGQAALWFDVLGGRPPFSLLQRIPGLSSFTERREAATNLFDSLLADGKFTTPEVNYRGVTLTAFNGSFALGGRQIRMKSSAFLVRDGRGFASGSLDFTASPPALSVQGSVTGLALQSLLARFAGPTHDLRGLVDSKGTIRTRGLTWNEMGENLTGRLEVRSKDVSFGSFDPLGTLAQISHWGKLEPVRGPVGAAPAILNLEISNRRVLLDPAVMDLGGAVLQLQGSYAGAGAVDLDVRADLRHLRRRWLSQDNDAQTLDALREARLTGTIDHLEVRPAGSMVTASRVRGGGIR